MRKIIALTSILVIAGSLIAGKHLWKGKTIYDEQWGIIPATAPQKNGA